MAPDRFAARLLVCVAALGFAPACGPKVPEPKPAKVEGAQWQDAFDLVPEVYVVVRPQAIKRDPIYGPFWKTVLRVASARSSLAGSYAVEVADGADEIIVGVGSSGAVGAAQDAMVVFRGVPASFDPRKMTDDRGQYVFDEGARGKVPEYVRRDKDAKLSLFVLPDRTWVTALGAARDRARNAYAAPFGRPVPKVEERALAAVRLDAPALLVPRLRRSPALGPLVKKLSSLTLALLPAKEGLEASLGYEDDDAAAWGEAHAQRLAKELGSADGPRLGRLEFVKTARISRVGNTVRLRFDVPARLLEELPNARPEEMWRDD